MVTNHGPEILFRQPKMVLLWNCPKQLYIQECTYVCISNGLKWLVFFLGIIYDQMWTQYDALCKASFGWIAHNPS